MLARFWSVLLVLLVFPSLLTAQASASGPHVAVQLVVPPSQLYPAQSFTAGLYFKLEPGWHVYWINAGDSGEPPSIHWTLPPGINAGALQFPAPRRLPLGPLMDFGYENEVLFPIAITTAPTLSASASAALAARVSWLVCREVCLPGHAQLSVERPVLTSRPAQPNIDAAAAQLVSRFQALLPALLPAGDQARFRASGSGFLLSVQIGSSDSTAQFFPLDQNVIKNAAPQPVTAIADGVVLSLAADENLKTAPGYLNGVLVLSQGRSYQIQARPGALASAAVTPAPTSGLLRIILLAFAGGILLNLMPCVFPVLFIKGLALVQASAEERHKLRLHGLIYALGILFSFWAVVGVLLALRGAGHQLGWGFQFQSPTFLALIALLLFFLGLWLAGMFEIGLTLTSAGGNLAAKSGYTGSFFTGVLAVIVATPCAAPFLGVAIGYALASSVFVTLGIFTALALGLAAPYLLLAFNPAWARILPRPGAWMEVLKQAVSIPIFATVIWLVWVFNLIAGGAVLVSLLAAFLLLAIAGWFLGRWPARRFATVIAVFILALAVFLPLWMVRVLPPAPNATAAAVASATEWQAYTPQLLAHYRAQGRPVFVDFTASWCLSCQVNERVILDRADVQQRLKDSGVALLRADWTRQDETITQALLALGRSSIPTYALYPAGANTQPRLLPEVLTPGIVFSALDSVRTPSASPAAALTSP
jgi:thiol:disulfide interchange protein